MAARFATQVRRTNRRFSTVAARPAHRLCSHQPQPTVVSLSIGPTLSIRPTRTHATVWRLTMTRKLGRLVAFLSFTVLVSCATPPTPGVTSVTIDGGDRNVELGESLTLTATVEGIG